MIVEINGKNYKEVKINKLVINGKEQQGQIIPADATKGAQEINVTVYTKDSDTAEQIKEEI